MTDYRNKLKKGGQGMLSLVTGGAASGKSEYAEQIAQISAEPRIYLATMPRIPEAEERIRKHTERRKNLGFQTIEDPYLSDLSDRNEKAGTILLEDLPNLLANRLFSHVQQEEIPRGDSSSCFSDDPGTSDNICEKDRKILEALLRDIRCLNEKTEHLIIVSGDIFRDGISYSDDTKRYVELLGMLHSVLAEMADRVVEVVCGIPIDH